jgi:osmotically-inducible protein OsmY
LILMVGIAGFEPTTPIEQVLQSVAFPQASPADLKKKIEAALVRSAEVDAKNITVEVQGGQAILKGRARTWSERQEG